MLDKKYATIHVQFRLHKISVPPFVLVGRPNILHSSKMNKTKCQNVLCKATGEADVLFGERDYSILYSFYGYDINNYIEESPVTFSGFQH